MIYHGAILRTYPVQPGKSHYRKAAVACCRAYFKSWDKTTRGPNSSGQRQADWTDPQFKFKAFSFPVLRPTLYSWKLEKWSPGKFRNSPGNFRNSPGNFRNSPALYFQFQGQEDILRETPWKPGQEIAKPNRLSWEGGPSTHPSPKRVIGSIAPAFPSTASLKENLEGWR